VKNAKIVLVAEWDGWCGACAADRPLVLTRTGRQRLRTWLTGAADDSRPLVLTCRLCGTGAEVPLEQDDPPVVVSAERELPALPPVVPAAIDAALADPVRATATTPSVAAELTAGRQVVAQALAGLLAQRAVAVTAPLPAPSPQLAPVPVPAPVLPLQRTPSNGGLAELQLLADGIDLLSSGRT
jgi:hypothetical protein